jgi:hypothetical protein
VAQTVRSDSLKAGSIRGGRYDLRYPSAAESAMRSPAPDKNCPNRSRSGTTAAQIGGRRITNIGGQRQALGTAALSPHNELSGSPVDVVELKRSDLACAQSEPDENGQDREIAPPRPCAAIT